MKKILALVLSLVLMMGTATTAFAANDQYYGTGYMEATAYSYGTCEFEIPATTDFSSMNVGGCTVRITSWDIDTTDTIIIMIDNANEGGGVTLNHNTKEDVTAELFIYRDSNLQDKYTNDYANPLWSFPYEDLEQLAHPEFTFYGRLDDNARAGGYTGTIQFAFIISDAY